MVPVEEQVLGAEQVETTTQGEGSNRVWVKWWLLSVIAAGSIIWGSIMTAGYVKYKSRSKDDDASSSVEYDRFEPVVIVGGGVSGNYVAWRLATAGDSPHAASEVHQYERTSSFSGRLFSPTIGTDLCSGEEALDGDSSELPRTELGGMRLRWGNDRLVMGVVSELGIETAPRVARVRPPTLHCLGDPAWRARSTLNGLGSI